MKEILVETSARHIHVTEEQFKILFGADAKLEVRAPLSQPGQFVSFSRLDIVGPKKTIGTPGIKLVGPAGELELAEGCIVAKRHIHMTPADAAEFGVENGQIVKLEVNCPGRSLVFGDVVVRVRDDFALAAHIDTDESNAAGCAGTVYGKLIK